MSFLIVSSIHANGCAGDVFNSVCGREFDVGEILLEHSQFGHMKHATKRCTQHLIIGLVFPAIPSHAFCADLQFDYICSVQFCGPCCSMPKCKLLPPLHQGLPY